MQLQQITCNNFLNRSKFEKQIESQMLEFSRIFPTKKIFCVVLNTRKFIIFIINRKTFLISHMSSSHTTQILIEK